MLLTSLLVKLNTLKGQIAEATSKRVDKTESVKVEMGKLRITRWTETLPRQWLLSVARDVELHIAVQVCGIAHYTHLSNYKIVLSGY